MSQLAASSYTVSHQHVNHLAILVSALIQWFLGALWYGLLFGKQWKELVGQKKKPSTTSTVVAMTSSFIGGLVLSFALAHVVLWSYADNFAWGAFIGLICWAGFVASVQFAQTLYEGRSFKLFGITVGYWLFAFLITGGLLAQWQ